MGTQVCRLLADAGHTVRAFDLPQANFAQLDELPGVSAQRGDLTIPDDARDAVRNTDILVHLAAVLPPQSESNRKMTFAVNVDGTQILVDALHDRAANTSFVFASSVVVYGATDAVLEPIDHTQPLCPKTLYAESKAAAEAVVRESGTQWTIARISGVAVSAVLEPPKPWPFTRIQRMEFVLADDVADAFARLAQVEEPDGQTVHISGGSTWRITGGQYATDYLNALGLPEDITSYLTISQAFGWYKPSAVLHDLGFKPTSYETYLEKVQAAVTAFMDEA